MPQQMHSIYTRFLLLKEGEAMEETNIHKIRDKTQVKARDSKIRLANSAQTGQEQV